MIETDDEIYFLWRKAVVCREGQMNLVNHGFTQPWLEGLYFEDSLALVFIHQSATVLSKIRQNHIGRILTKSTSLLWVFVASRGTSAGTPYP
jgi:hypothetical protein